MRREYNASQRSKSPQRRSGSDLNKRVNKTLQKEVLILLTSVHLLWATPGAVLIIVLLIIKFPLDDGAIAGAGDEEFALLAIASVFLANGEGGDPATVGLEETFLLEFVGSFLCHFGMLNK